MRLVRFWGVKLPTLRAAEFAFPAKVWYDTIACAFNPVRFSRREPTNDDRSFNVHQKSTQLYRRKI